MALFPHAYRATGDLVEVEEWHQERNWGRGVRRQIAERAPRALYQCRLAFELGSQAGDEIAAFYSARHGAYSTFDFYSPNAKRRHEDITVGTGDGSECHFLAPITDMHLRRDDSDPPTLTVNAVAKVLGTDWEYGVENRVVYSEALNQPAVWVEQGGESFTMTTGHADPLGGSTAWRCLGDGLGAGTEKLRQTIGTPTVGDCILLDLWLHVPATKPHIWVSDNNGNSQEVEDTGIWTRVTLTDAAASADHHAAFSTPGAGDVADFYLWHPWAAWEASLWGIPRLSWGYIPTGSAAKTADTTLRKQRISFYSGSAPGSSHAIVLTAATGRRLYTASFDGQPQTVQMLRWRRYGMEYTVRSRL